MFVFISLYLIGWHLTPAGATSRHVPGSGMIGMKQPNISTDRCIMQVGGSYHASWWDEGFSLLRLQLKPGLFWYRHYPKLHEMVKYRSSRAENWTNRSGISRRVFFNSKKCFKMIIWSKKTQKCCFSWKKIFEKPHASHQICKKWKIRYNPVNFD